MVLFLVVSCEGHKVKQQRKQLTIGYSFLYVRSLTVHFFFDFSSYGVGEAVVLPGMKTPGPLAAGGAPDLSISGPHEGWETEPDCFWGRVDWRSFFLR
jgi:hypothetical protein